MKTLFTNLPSEVQQEVKNTLSAYSECRVYKKQDGSFYATTVIVLHNGDYDELLGNYDKDEVFTKEEQILNYVRSFRDFPLDYKGARDWKAINKTTWTDVAFDDKGDIIFI